MADTESDPGRGLRLTLRLRLTVLYGAVFIIAGAGLLTATYALFKHNQRSSQQTLALRGVQFTLPAGANYRTGGSVSFQRVKPAPSSRLSASGNARTTSAPGNARTTTSAPGNARTTTSALGKGSAENFVTTTTPPKQLLNKIRTSGQRQLLFLAARANARLRTEQSNDASSLLEWSAVALGVVALLSIGLAWWLAGRALRPLRTMNTRAREISAESLHQRLGVDDRRDELGELATTFDALLARLESSFESQRRFVANASHELRTPITLERTLVEVALADPDASVESLRRVCERIVSSTEEQERLLDALLTLARSEAGVAAGESVDLAAVTEDALLARESELARISVESSLEPAVVIGDQALLERLVGNLLDNAIVHNGGDRRRIAVATLTDADGVPVLRIANGGEPIAADQVDELFEPFRRGVGERLGTDGRGLGLGLSIVRAVAIAHSAQIEARGLPDGGLELELHFTSVTTAGPAVGGVEALAT